MRIGILGCGYVGQSIALQWRNERHLVTATTRRPEKKALLQEYVNDVCLLNPQSFPSFIAHQEALLISVAPDSSSDYATTYLQTAQQVAELIKEAPLLRYILYTSSTSLYGDHQGAWVNEETPIRCTNENAKVLYETECTLLSCTSPHLHVCILRLGEIYGPGREIAQRLKRMQHQPFAGKGDAYTNLIHIEDIVKALTFALNHDLQGIYNLCNDFHIPRKQFYEQICQQENICSIQWDPTRLNQHGGNRRVSNQKIKNAGFSFNYPDYFPIK